MPFSRTEPNVPAYEEDKNSPYIATNTASKQFTVAGDFDQFLLIPAADDPGHDVLRVNGDSGQNYDTLGLDGTTQIDSTGITIGARLNLVNRIVVRADRSANQIAFSIDIAETDSDAVVAAENRNVSPPIDTFTVDNSFGGTPTSKLRGFGLNL